MPIRWNALEVSEAMDEVEELVRKAEPFLVEAEDKAGQATGIRNLPEYMSQRLHRLIFSIQARQNIKVAIANTRASIPEGAIEADRQKRRQLSLDAAPCQAVQHNHFAEWLAQQMEEE
jgi:hypothetical protein